MDKDNFIQILRNPQTTTDSEFQELETVVSQYPYFQTARAIIASASRSLHKSDANKKLSKAAIYTTNRNLLKKYVEGNFDFSLANEVQLGITNSSLLTTNQASAQTQKKKGGRFIYVEKEKESIEDLGKGKFIDLTKNTDDDEDYEIIKVSSQSAPKKSTHQIIENPTSKTEEIKKDQNTTSQINNENKKDVENLTQRQKLASKKDVVQDLPVKPKANTDELVNEVFRNLEEYQKKKHKYDEVEKKIQDIEENDAVNEAILRASMKLQNPPTAATDNEKKIEKEQVVVSNQKIKTDETSLDEKSISSNFNPVKIDSSSSEIMNTNGDADNLFDRMVAEIKSNPTPMIEEKPIQNKETGFVSISKSLQAKGKNKINKKELQSEIIENFIKSNPRIVPQEIENQETMQDLSMQSVEMKEDLATENLAKILIRQGKREKAIEIYEKLILLNPDKRSYFVAEISKLK